LRWQPLPVTAPFLQVCDEQDVGQSPSQSSPLSTTPLPQTGLQSLSLLALQPEGQQPSLFLQAVMVTKLHLAEQPPPFCSVSLVQALLSLQLVGHLPAPEVMPMSQSSPLSTAPLPQLTEQSLSLLLVQPDGQQPSPSLHCWICVFLHWALQLPGLSRSSWVQLSLSSQEVGHAPGLPATMPLSQASPASSAPLPQLAEQSLSLLLVQPEGQQLSPSLHCWIGELVH
jgi:hypothetical protein